MKFKEFISIIIKKIKDFFYDESGGNLVEYALLIGFALFIFFILIGIITGMLEWVQDLADDFLQIFG